MLPHTTAWDQHWGGDETLKCILIDIIALPCLASLTQGPEGDQDYIIFILTHTKQLQVMTFYETIKGIGTSFQTHGQTEGQSDIEAEKVI